MSEEKSIDKEIVEGAEYRIEDIASIKAMYFYLVIYSEGVYDDYGNYFRWFSDEHLAEKWLEGLGYGDTNDFTIHARLNRIDSISKPKVVEMVKRMSFE